MKRVSWVKQVGICLVAMLMLVGVARADPVGTSSVFQFVRFASYLAGPSTNQQVFLTTDFIGFRADYFDPNPACAGVAPVLAELFIFTAEGLFKAQISTSNGPGLDPGAKYRGVFHVLSPGFLPPGSYTATYLVRDCANTDSIVRVPFLAIRVVAP
jgi:hypothetical protein